MKNFLAELKRRNVHKGAIVYAVIAWLLIQIAFIPLFEVPSWAIKTLIVLLVLGFVAVVFGAANTFGGFVVTDRMLEMFRKRAPEKPSETKNA